MTIHPTAVVSPDAKIGEGAQIGPYAIIGPDITIGKNTIIGGDPQDLKFKGEKTRVVIGNNNIIREFVTINRATSADIGITLIGNNNLLMAYCHVAHNCKLGNNIVMANSANLAGHIHIEDFAIIGGLSGIHQFTRIGQHAFVGGASAVAKDVPPFLTVAGNHAKPYGLNLVGLRRRGFKEDTLKNLKQAYKLVYRSSLLLSAALDKIRSEVPDTPEVRQFVEFIEKSERGICR